jgi:hypothetical protein
MLRTVLCLIPITILIGCSGTPEFEIPEEIAALENLAVFPADAEPVHEISLEKVAVFGDTDDVLIGQIGSFTTDDRGRVFLVDINQRTIHLFKPDGEWIGRIGSEGEGPGEFRGIGTLRTVHGMLHAIDANLRRISRFDLETLELHSTVSLSEDQPPVDFMFPHAYFVRPDGSYLVFFTAPFLPDDDSETRYWDSVVLNENGRYESEVFLKVRADEWLVDSGEDFIRAFPPPYGRISRFAMSDDGQLYHAWSEHMMIKVYDTDGSYARAIYHHYPKVPLRRDDVLEAFADREERDRSILRARPMPDTWPAFGMMHLDDENRIWLATITDNRDEYNWWVLESSGELLATFTWPRSKAIRHIHNGYVYTGETDEETGLQKIVKYEIKLI